MGFNNTESYYNSSHRKRFGTDPRTGNPIRIFSSLIHLSGTSTLEAEVFNIQTRLHRSIGQEKDLGSYDTWGIFVPDRPLRYKTAVSNSGFDIVEIETVPNEFIPAYDYLYEQLDWARTNEKGIIYSPVNFPRVLIYRPRLSKAIDLIEQKHKEKDPKKRVIHIVTDGKKNLHI